jgi:TetR/AcrR family transcriptional regulator
MEKNKDAEKDIINAARKVFYNKGFKEASMRDIATEANVNLAMVNYYFRSKENLFYIIFDEAFGILYNKIAEIAKKESVDIIEKIKTIINEYSDFFNKQPHILIFILGEVFRNPEKIGIRIRSKLQQSNAFSVLNKQFETAIINGIIKPVSTLSVLINILSLIIFPLLAKPLINEALNIDSNVMDSILESRKQDVADIIINSISP